MRTTRISSVAATSTGTAGRMLPVLFAAAAAVARMLLVLFAATGIAATAAAALGGLVFIVALP